MVFLLLLAAMAQPAPSRELMAEVDPIRCWWRTSAGGVRIGETFSLDLTCAVLDNEAVQVVPDESRLGGNVIQLSPFEVVDSSHPADLRSGQRRFFQYHYTLRIINPDTIGMDVPIPILAIRYRVNSRMPGNAALQGRDLSYLLPPQSIKILSIVPADANDIRDASGQSFTAVESLNLRAGVLEIVAMTLTALGSLTTLAVIVGAFRRSGRAEQGARAVGGSALLGAAARELAAVERDAGQDGWSDALVDRALASTRIAAAVGLDRPVSQRPAPAGAHAGGGLLVTRRPRRGGRVAISSSLTPGDAARRLAGAPPDGPDRSALDRLQSAMAAFTRLQYRRDGALDRGALDEALASAREAVSHLRARHLWPRPQLRRWTNRLVAGYRA